MAEELEKLNEQIKQKWLEYLELKEKRRKLLQTLEKEDSRNGAVTF